MPTRLVPAVGVNASLASVGISWHQLAPRSVRFCGNLIGANVCYPDGIRLLSLHVEGAAVDRNSDNFIARRCEQFVGGMSAVISTSVNPYWRSSRRTEVLAPDMNHPLVHVCTECDASMFIYRLGCVYIAVFKPDPCRQACRDEKGAVGLI
jgi:hypothetical protein